MLWAQSLQMSHNAVGVGRLAGPGFATTLDICAERRALVDNGVFSVGGQHDRPNHPPGEFFPPIEKGGCGLGNRPGTSSPATRLGNPEPSSRQAPSHNTTKTRAP